MILENVTFFCPAYINVLMQNRIDICKQHIIHPDGRKNYHVSFFPLRGKWLG